MVSTTTIPGVLIAPMREGAYAVSRDVAEAIDQGDGLSVCRERLAGVCRLLDVIGWMRDDPAADTEIDLGVLAATLRSAVEIMLPILRGADRERELYETLRDFASAELPSVPRRLEIPIEVVLLLRSVLHVELVTAAGDLAAECSLAAPVDCAEKLARFDGVRALLDAVGWTAPEYQQALVIDFALHGQMIQDVLETDLDTMRYLAETDDVRQRERATKTAALIERFLGEMAETPREPPA